MPFDFKKPHQKTEPWIFVSSPVGPSSGKARAFAEIGEYFRMPVRTYSSGMRARLAFGLSMALDFDTYLVDEVTAVGDKAFQEKSPFLPSRKGVVRTPSPAALHTSG